MVELARRLDGQHPGGLGKLVFREPPLGLEPATRGRCEALIGQPEVGDLCEHLASPLQPLLRSCSATAVALSGEVLRRAGRTTSSGWAKSFLRTASLSQQWKAETSARRVWI